MDNNRKDDQSSFSCGLRSFNVYLAFHSCQSTYGVITGSSLIIRDAIRIQERCPCLTNLRLRCQELRLSCALLSAEEERF